MYKRERLNQGEKAPIFPSPVLSSPQKEIVEDCVNALLDHLNSASLKIINYTTGALNLIAQNIRSLTYMEKVGMEVPFQNVITQYSFFFRQWFKVWFKR